MKKSLRRRSDNVTTQLTSSDIEKNNTAAISIQNLSKRYGKTYAIKNLNFNIYPGQFHGFIGANGAGKTTTIKSVIGAYAKYEGQIKIFGKSNKSIEAKKHLGYIPEAANFPDKLSTFKYLSYMAYLTGYSAKAAKQFAREKIAQLGLEKLAKKSPNDFSSGQKKKVLLAQALIGEPDVIVMDEPAANLDPMARYDFFEELKKLQQKGKAILISSHILTELDNFVDSVTIIDGGKVAYTGTIEKLDDKDIKEFIFKFMTTEADIEFVKYLKNKQIKFSLKNKKIYAMMETDAILNNTLAFIQHNKLPVDIISRNKLNLTEIYNKFVVEGSVATGTGRNNGNKEVSNA